MLSSRCFMAARWRSHRWTVDRYVVTCHRVIRVKMKTETVLLFLTCYFLAGSIAEYQFLSDNYVEGKGTNVKPIRATSYCVFVFSAFPSYIKHAYPAFLNLEHSFLPDRRPRFSRPFSNEPIEEIVILDRNIADDAQQYDDFDRLTSLRKYAFDDDRESRRNIDGELENWTGRWMPDRPNEVTPSPKVVEKVDPITLSGSSQSLHGVPMGHPSRNCDDAKVQFASFVL